MDIILPNDTQEYTMTTVSGDAEEIYYYVDYVDYFLYVKADNAVGSMFSPDCTLALYGNEGEYELTIADNSYSSHIQLQEITRAIYTRILTAAYCTSKQTV